MELNIFENLLTTFWQTLHQIKHSPTIYAVATVATGEQRYFIRRMEKEHSELNSKNICKPNSTAHPALKKYIDEVGYK